MAGQGLRGSTGVLTPPSDDDVGLGAFCRREYPRLVGMIGLYSGDRDLAEDLAQESLARLCRDWSRLPTEDDARRWVTRVAMNLAKSNMRTHAGRRRILARYGASMHGRASDDNSTTALAVRAAVAVLPDRQRRVIILRYFCDLPVADVAALMKCPEGTVKSLTSLAVASLRRSGLEFADD